MKRIILLASVIVIAYSIIGCSSSLGVADEVISMVSEWNTESPTTLTNEENVESRAIEGTISEEAIEEPVTEIWEMTSLIEWDSARWDFFEPYMNEPTSLTSTEDYFELICYMLLNHIYSYEFTVENPDYDTETAKNIIEEDFVAAYNQATLFLNTYTDFWSLFTASCSQTVASNGEVLSFTYTIDLTQKYGRDNISSDVLLMLAEEACYDLVNEMFADSRLSAEMSQQERAYVLYQWVCENVEYAYDAPDVDSDEVKPDTCYDAMVEKCAVCQGISGAYVQLCRMAGVEMYVQLGITSEGAHSWCKILDEDTGEWMYIDPTWGITGALPNEEYSDTWFWVTQEFMENYSGNEREFSEYLD